MSLRYRPEIDGLRAVAIGAVLIYHLKLTVGGVAILQGGFLGVDIFFVISGYLITGIILSRHAQDGTFSYAEFYERRARRLLPALLTVLLASSVAATLILMPGAMKDFAWSALASIGFLSNVYWHLASQQYGAASGLYQPLLHTWSLAVEEQFYLLFPVFLLIGLRWFPGRLLAISFGIVLVGLVLATVLTEISFSFSFYWLLSRVWEMMAGAILAQFALKGRPLPTSGLVRVLPSLGLALIIGSMLFVPLTFLHPGLGTLPAILGVALVIGFAAPGEPVTRLLTQRGPVWIGLISYSLYLWHYPIYAFGRLLRPELGVFDYIGWIALSLALAYATYRLVERPFRDRGTIPLPRLAGTVAAGTAVIAVFAAVMLATGGLRERLPGMIALYGPNEFDNPTLAERSWGLLAERATAAGFDASGPRDAVPFEKTVDWFDPAGPQRRILLVGDSHSKDMFNVLTQAANRGNSFQVARFALPLLQAEKRLDDLLSAPNFAAADTIVLTYRYFDQTIPHLPAIIRAAQAAGKHVAILSNTVEFPEPSGSTLFDVWLQQARTLDAPAFNRRAWDHRLARPDAINDALREMARSLDVRFLSKADFMCDATVPACTVVTPDGRKVFYDYGHYSLEGARYFGDRVAELGWFDP